MATVYAERPSLTFIRRFRASPDKVWRALTQPQAMKEWMAPSDQCSMPVAEADVRVGGRYHLVMLDSKGAEHDLTGTYREVVPNRRLVYTWSWLDAAERRSLVTLELRPTPEGTELTLTHEQFSDTAERNHHEHGWSSTLARLERLLI